MKKLNQKHHKFIELYMISNNGTQSAIDAGFSERTAAACASRLLKAVKVRDEILRLNNRIKEKVVVDKAWVLNQAALVHERCMQQVPVIVSGKKTGEYRFDASGANKALDIIGKHVDILAFDNTVRHTGDPESPIHIDINDTERAARLARILQLAMERVDKDNS